MTPPDSTSQNASGSGAPGKRHATATIAIGSSVRPFVRGVAAGANWGADAAREPKHVTEQVIHHIDQTRVIHRQGRRYLLAHRLLDAVPQFDGHQRIHAEIEESGVLADLRGVDARHLGYGAAQVIRQ